MAFFYRLLRWIRTEYSISGAGTAKQDFYLVNVEVSTKNKNIPDKDLIKAAVNGVLFAVSSNAGFGDSQKPLAGDASMKPNMQISIMNSSVKTELHQIMGRSQMALAGL